MLKHLTGTEKMSITPPTSSNYTNIYIVIPYAGTDAKNLAMNLKILTEASQLTTICDAGINAPGVGTPCLPAHVSFSQNMIFHTVGRRYSSGNSILRGVPLFPPSYSSIQQELLKANLACCYFVTLPPSQTISSPSCPLSQCSWATCGGKLDFARLRPLESSAPRWSPQLHVQRWRSQQVCLRLHQEALHTDL